MTTFGGYDVIGHRPRSRVRVARATVAMIMLSLLALGAAQAGEVTPTNTWMNLYSTHCTFAGLPIPVGTIVAVFDPQGTQCGERVVTTAGYISPVMPCYGDDPFTSVDEGPRQGDLLYFTLNGSAVTPQAVSRNFDPVPLDTPVIWTAMDIWQINLIMPPRPPVTVTLAADELHLEWQPVGDEVVQYEIWRSTAFYFAPGDDGAERLAVVMPDGSAPLSWSDGAGVGDTELNYAYRVQSLNTLSQVVGISQAVAEFDYVLYR